MLYLQAAMEGVDVSNSYAPEASGVSNLTTAQPEMYGGTLQPQFYYVPQQVGMQQNLQSHRQMQQLEMQQLQMQQLQMQQLQMQEQRNSSQHPPTQHTVDYGARHYAMLPPPAPSQPQHQATHLLSRPTPTPIQPQSQRSFLLQGSGVSQARQPRQQIETETSAAVRRAIEQQRQRLIQEGQGQRPEIPRQPRQQIENSISAEIQRHIAAQGQQLIQEGQGRRPEFPRPASLGGQQQGPHQHAQTKPHPLQTGVSQARRPTSPLTPPISPAQQPPSRPGHTDKDDDVILVGSRQIQQQQDKGNGKAEDHQHKHLGGDCASSHLQNRPNNNGALQQGHPDRTLPRGQVYKVETVNPKDLLLNPERHRGQTGPTQKITIHDPAFEYDFTGQTQQRWRNESARRHRKPKDDSILRAQRERGRLQRLVRHLQRSVDYARKQLEEAEDLGQEPSTIHRQEKLEELERQLKTAAGKLKAVHAKRRVAPESARNSNDDSDTEDDDMMDMAPKELRARIIEESKKPQV